MKKTIKKSLKFILNKPWYIFKRYQDFCRKSKSEVSFIEFVTSKKFIFSKKDKLKQFQKMLRKINIDIDHNSRFQHWIDEDLYFQNKFNVVGNMPPEYSLIINNGINDLVNEYSKNSNIINLENIKLLSMVDRYIDRIIADLSQQSINASTKNSVTIFTNMKDKKAENLEEALQRILLWSSIFWQTGHSLVGLGRLDKILNEFENTDKEVAKTLIKDFLKKLHEHYDFKSASLKGDIGQIIILGGLEENGQYFTNKLTYIFIDALEELKVSDPKILLRVSKNTPENLLKRALQCIQSGIGSPLLSNDDIVIPSLINFGYDSKDAHNYVTSACWEPVIYGNSLEQNNLAEINYAKVFNNCIDSEKFTQCEGFEEFLELYKNEMKVELNNITEKLSSIQWEKEPLFTLFTKNCSRTNKSISYGGAKYNNYGILSVGMANTVNSISNLNELVYQSKKFTTQQIKEIIFNENFEETNLNKLCNNIPECFGKEDEMAIYITNKILDDMSKYLSNYRNPLGGTVKFGLSSPGYITAGDRTKATLDGRIDGKPLSVHISSAKGSTYTELINFSSRLDYKGNKTNGNVVDFFVSPDFIEKNFEKFFLFIKAAIKQGFFQMQMNVVSSKQLIEARKNPEKFPNLIVRVWGFSAYFKDLPDEYKDVLIARAIESEKVA